MTGMLLMFHQIVIYQHNLFLWILFVTFTIYAYLTT